jgi:hypothetical protein
MRLSCDHLKVCALLCTLVLTACGGDSEEPSGAAAPPTGNAGANRAPAVTGSPPTSVSAGESFEFVPNASDADGDSLTFSIENLPAWASFNAATGAVSGTPTAADVGTYSGITLTVSDGTSQTVLGPYSVTVDASGTLGVTLSWTPPLTNSDGTTLGNLAGYRIYYGPTAGSYPKRININGAGLSRYDVTGLAAGTYYFVMTSVNSVGVESAPSEPVAITLTEV